LFLELTILRLSKKAIFTPDWYNMLKEYMTNQTAKVIVYSTPWCVYCHMAKEYLTGRGVQFSEVDVGADQQAARQLVAKTGQLGVPVIEVGKETILGFDRQRIDLALRDNKLA